jgi:SsrA-binding protein
VNLLDNKKARFDYYIEDTWEAGIVLTGTEIKSLRLKQGILNQSYVIFRKGEAYIVGMVVHPYKEGNVWNHSPGRDRKLLLHKEEIAKISKKVDAKGFTCVPLVCYINKRNLVKIQIGIGKGKTQVDKRHIIKEREENRNLLRLQKRL